MNRKRFYKTVAVAFVILVQQIGMGRVSDSEEAFSNLIPIPQEIRPGEGRYRIEKTFTVKVSGNPDERMYAAASRFLRRLDERTGLFLPQDYVEADEDLSEVGLEFVVERAGQIRLGEDESYRLAVSLSGVRIEAQTDLGAMHGMETLLQLLSADAEGYYFPVCSIEDSPRFPWRGLMIDSARHFMPMDVIKRNLDGMSAVKLNVMHWHLTEDQGFRVEVKSYPRLHEMGSDGLYYTQEQLREIVAYAADRGIRVYPELDVPGHATSWLVGHPEMASLPGPYEIERGWGIFDPTLDPTKEVVYEILEAVFTEMAEIFPDEYFHIGGDENEGHHWDKAEHIQAFMKERGIRDNHELQSFFNKRLLTILNKLGKKMVGWDEILQPDMPTNIVIHSWRGKDSMVAAAKAGYSSILSNGYYIDLMQPASDHYLVDPLPADIDLDEAQRSRVYGGEATMWSEHVTLETVDSRIWPRTAAIAERFWSDQSVNDVDDMYRRLDTIALQLEELGLTHLKNREMMMRRLANSYHIEPLRVLADVVEPLKIYRRNADLSYRSFSPYTLLPDVAVADAKDARRFNAMVDAYLKTGHAADKAAVRSQLERWTANNAAFADLAAQSPALREALPLSEALRDLAQLGLRALDGEAGGAASILEKARLPVAKVELQVVDTVERLLPH